MSHHEKIKKSWENRLKPPKVHSCFCHEFRCQYRDYSLCPKDCEKPSVNKVCPQGDCQMQLKHPEECEKQVQELQEMAGEKPTHIDGQPVIERRPGKR